MNKQTLVLVGALTALFAATLLSFLILRGPQLSDEETTVSQDVVSNCDQRLASIEQELKTLHRRLDQLLEVPAPSRTPVLTASMDSGQLARQEDRLQQLENEVARIAESVRQINRPSSSPSIAIYRPSQPSKLQLELKARLDRIDATDALALFQLSEWAETQGLKADAKRLLRKVIKAERDHPEARRKLGYLMYKGRWVTVREKDRIETARRTENQNH